MILFLKIYHLLAKVFGVVFFGLIAFSILYIIMILFLKPKFSWGGYWFWVKKILIVMSILIGVGFFCKWLYRLSKM